MRDGVTRRFWVGRCVAALAASLAVAGCGASAHRLPLAGKPKETRAQMAAAKARAASARAREARIRLAKADPLVLISQGVSPSTGKPAAVRPGSPSGVSMPTGNIRGWKQVFADDFPASEDAAVGRFGGCSFNSDVCRKLPAATSAKWFAYPDGVPDTWGVGRYTPSQVVSIHDHILELHLHTSLKSGTHEVAALVPKIPTGTSQPGMRYGAYVVRFRAAMLPGYEAAFQLWPDSHNGLSDGEIGFPAGPLSGPVLAWLHWRDATSEAMNYQFATGRRFSRWHTAVLEREPGRVRFILDGKLVALVTRHLPTSPMYWVLQTEAEQPPHIPTANVSGDVEFAWVTAYAWDPHQHVHHPAG